MLSILQSHSTWRVVSIPSCSIWLSLAILGLGANSLHCASISLYAWDGLILVLVNLGFVCSDKDAFNLTLNIVLQLSTIDSDYAKDALLLGCKRHVILMTKYG